MDLFFYNIQTGETKKVNHSTDWLNHLQFLAKPTRAC